MLGIRKPLDKLSDEALMELIAERNQRAFSVLYDRYAERLINFFYGMLWKDREKARDFTQELFTKLVHKPELFNPERSFKTWVFSVANNMCKNEYRRLEVRKNTRNEEHIEVNGHQNLENDVHVKMFADHLYRELDTMDEDRKTAFLMKYREGFSTKEISKAIGCNEGTVKSRLFYTNKRLSEKLHAFNPKHDKN